MAIGYARLEATQRHGTVSRRLAVHRSQHGDLGDVTGHAEPCGHGGVHVVVPGGSRECVVVRHCREDPGLDLAEVGADEHVVRLGDDRRAEFRGHVVQPRGRGHPAGRAVRRRPLPSETPVGPDVLVEPAVPEGGGDALGLAPGEQRVDDLVLVTQLLETPGAGVGHLDADASQQRLHAGGVAQIEVAERTREMRGARGGRVRRRAVASSARVDRSWTDERRDDPLGLGDVDGQAVGFELGAQQRGRRFRSCGARCRRAGRARRPSSSSCRRWTSSASAAQRPQVVEVRLPEPVDPGRVEVPVGADRVDTVVVAGLARTGREPPSVGRSVGVEALAVGPDPPGAAAPTTDEEPVDGLEIPAARRAEADADEGSGGVGRPPDPAGGRSVRSISNRAGDHSVGRRVPAWHRRRSPSAAPIAVGDHERDRVAVLERRSHPQPSSWSRSSSMPAAWAISWMTVT